MNASVFLMSLLATLGQRRITFTLISPTTPSRVFSVWQVLTNLMSWMFKKKEVQISPYPIKSELGCTLFPQEVWQVIWQWVELDDTLNREGGRQFLKIIWHIILPLFMLFLNLKNHWISIIRGTLLYFYKMYFSTFTDQI